MGPEVYSTLRNMLAPAKPKDTQFTDIIRILEKHYNPKPLEIAQSFHFGTRDQKSEESVNNVKNYVPINPLTAEWAPRALIDFTLSNTRRFYSSMGNPLDGKGLMIMYWPWRDWWSIVIMANIWIGRYKTDSYVDWTTQRYKINYSTQRT